MTTNDTTAHPFEKAGLGVAPFRYIGSEYKVGPIVTVLANGITASSGSPGQPMGSCDYCGTGIAECCRIADSTGKVFIVGNVCVQKTLGGSDSISKAAKRDNDRARRVRTKAGEVARIAALDEALATDAVLRATIAAQPHPKGFDGKTMLDWARWMWANSGHAGKLKTVRAIDKIRKAVAKGTLDAVQPQEAAPVVAEPVPAAPVTTEPQPKFGDGSEHVGTVGERREFEFAVAFTRECFGMYGASWMVKGTDAAGNVFVFFYTGSDAKLWDVRGGDVLKVKATVKAHDSFRDVNQTVLSRAAFVSVRDNE